MSKTILRDLYEKKPMDQYRNQYLYLLYLSLFQWECLPQLPLSERTKMAERFKETLQRYHYSLADYHERECFWALKEGKIEKAEKHFEKYWPSFPTVVSPCRACKQAAGVRYVIWKDDWDGALVMAGPLIDGTLKCEQEPRKTYCNLMNMALDRGDREQADRFAKLLKDSLEQGDEEFSDLIRYMAFVDTEEGLRILEACLPDILDEWDQEVKRDFFQDAWVLCVQLARQKNEITIDFPPQFPLYRKDKMYDPNILADWFYSQALEISKMFDERNGYPWHQNKLKNAMEGMKKMEKDADFL